MSRDPIEERLKARPLPDLTDPDNPEWTEADFAKARPPEEVLPPEVLAQFPNTKRRGRPPAAVRKEHVSLRLDAEVLAFFRNQGRGWQSDVEGILKAEMKRRAK
jgi:uncharacterized protein (DUF4415 family)